MMNTITINIAQSWQDWLAERFQADARRAFERLAYVGRFDPADFLFKPEEGAVLGHLLGRGYPGGLRQHIQSLAIYAIGSERRERGESSGGQTVEESIAEAETIMRGLERRGLVRRVVHDTLSPHRDEWEITNRGRKMVSLLEYIKRLLAAEEQFGKDLVDDLLGIQNAQIASDALRQARDHLWNLYATVNDGEEGVT